MESQRGRIEVPSYIIRGCEAVPVTVSAEFGAGDVHDLDIGGLQGRTASDLAATVRSAITGAGFALGTGAVRIDISPAFGSTPADGLALPAAAAYLALTGQVSPDAIAGRVLVGGLDADGRVRPCPGTRLFQASSGPGTTILGSLDLDGTVAGREDGAAAVAGIDGLRSLAQGHGAQIELRAAPSGGYDKDLDDLDVGREVARAIEIACAGGHHLVLSGSDPEMLRAVAERVATCLPKPTREEGLAMSALESICGDPLDPAPIETRPTAIWDCAAGTPGELVGGGRPPAPGAISRASGGVLVLEHLERMPGTVGVMLANALRDKSVRLVRSDGAVRMPADTMAVGCIEAGAPLPEAFRGLPCVCVEVGELRDGPGHVNSAQVRRRVERARSFARDAEERDDAFSQDPEDLVARTVADLDESRYVYADHQGEAYALTYRATGRPYGPQKEASLLDSLAEEASTASRADAMATRADPQTDAPARGDARHIAVRTSLGTLRAEVVDGEDGYPGISVVLERDDGSSGFVSLTEVCEADVAPDGSRPRLQTHSYDGVAEEPVTVECDPDGPWMTELPSPELLRQDADRPLAPFTPEMVSAAVRDRTIGYGMATEVARRLNATAEEAFLESLPLQIDDDAIAAVVAQVARGTSLDRFADSKTEEASPSMRPGAGSAPLPGDGLR